MPDQIGESNEMVGIVGEDEDRSVCKHNRKAWKAWKLSSTTGMMIHLYEEAVDDEIVMLGVAWNPVTPVNILENLMASQLPKVKAAALERLTGNGR